jgi:hypothetical protein
MIDMFLDLLEWVAKKRVGIFYKLLFTFLLVGWALSYLLKYLLGEVHSETIHYNIAVFLVLSVGYLIMKEHIIKIPNANEAIALQNYFISVRVIGFLSNSGEINTTRGQRVITTGINWKWPWELPIGDPIKLERFTHTGNTKSQASDGQELNVPWTIILGRIPDMRLLRGETIDKASVIESFTTDADLFIQSILKEGTSSTILANPRTFFEPKLKQFKDDKLFDATEDSTGFSVERLSVSAATKNIESIKVDEDQANASKIDKTVSEALKSVRGEGEIVKSMIVAAALRAQVPDNVLVALSSGGRQQGGKKGRKNEQ